jgi:hypothetical protein
MSSELGSIPTLEVKFMMLIEPIVPTLGTDSNGLGMGFFMKSSEVYKWSFGLLHE